MKKRIISAGRRGIFFTFLLLAAALVLPEEAFSARGGSSGDHSRRPSDPGGTINGDILGDLWVVLRNVGTGEEGNGKPIKVKWIWPETAYDPATGELAIEAGDIPDSYEVVGDDDPDGCIQPVSFNLLDDWPIGVDQTRLQSDLNDQDLYFNSYGNPQLVYLIPLDAECNIPDAYADSWGTQVTEVDSGRLALARTTQYVIDAAYEEALTALNTATSVGLGPAGRLLIGLTDGTERIIDSPRENLALYQRLMKDGCLSSTDNVSLTTTAQEALDAGGLENLVCPDSDTAEDNEADLQVAASFLAGAADKSGDIGIDEVVYLNSILGINTVEASPTDGSLIVTGYFNFGDFTYHRNATYGGKTADLLQPPVGWTEDQGYPASFTVVNGMSIYSGVFGTGDWDGESNYSNMPVINFVRAADDAVSVIFYIHNYELPVYPVPLEAEPTQINNLQQQNQLRGPVFLQ